MTIPGSATLLRAEHERVDPAPSWYRDPQLWIVGLATALGKALAIGLGLTVFSHRRWLRELESALWAWGKLLARVRAGRWPHIDFADTHPVLRSELYAGLARMLGPDEQRFMVVHALLMAAVDVVNAAIFYRLARALRPRWALGASLAFSLSMSGIVFGSLSYVSVVVTCLLVGYALYTRRRPLLAAGVWGVGGCLHGFAWLVIAVQALAARRAHPGARAERRAVYVFALVWLSINLPFALLDHQRHGNFDAWVSALRPSAASFSTLLTVAQLWLGTMGWERNARLITLGLVVGSALSMPRAQPSLSARALAITGLCAVLVDSVYPPEWNLCVYPFLMLALLGQRSARIHVLIALYLALDLSHVIAYPFGYVHAMRELSAGAAHPTGARTWSWSAAIIARSISSVLIVRELYLEPVPRQRRAWSMHEHIPFVLAMIFVVAQAAWISDATRDMHRISDENVHVAQIELFYRNHFHLHKAITMFPGYHALAATIGKALGGYSRMTLRALNTALGVCAFLLALAIERNRRSRFPVARSLESYFVPLVFPYYFMAFTDVLGLVLALLCLWCVLKRSWTSAAMFSALAICVRQTNVILPLFIVGIALLEQHKTQRFVDWARCYLAKIWLAAALLLAFAVFVWLNGGVAVGDRQRHALGVHAGNVYLTLALVCLVSLPINFENLWRRRSRLGSLWFWLALLALAALYPSGFRGTHVYNIGPQCLRNDLIHWVEADAWHRALFFIPIALGFGALWVTPLTSRHFWVIVPLALLILVPEELIEQRYAIVPVVFWSLVRRDGSRSAEIASAVLNAGMSLVLVYEVLQGNSL